MCRAKKKLSCSLTVVTWMSHITVQLKAAERGLWAPWGVSRVGQVSTGVATRGLRLISAACSFNCLILLDIQKAISWNPKATPIKDGFHFQYNHFLDMSQQMISIKFASVKDFISSRHPCVVCFLIYIKSSSRDMAMNYIVSLMLLTFVFFLIKFYFFSPVLPWIIIFVGLW